MSLLVPEKVIFACESACDIRAPKVITEKSMLRGPVDSLMSSQVLRCDESFATGGADLSLGTVPASVVALKTSANCIYPIRVLKRQATYSFSDFEAKVLPQSWQDSDADDPAWEGAALRFFRLGGGAPGRANFPMFVRSDTL